MHRLAPISLIAAVFLLSSGALARMHDAAHAMADEQAIAQAQRDHQPAPAPEQHDETNCALHAQLNVPIAPVGYVPLLILLGLFVAFLTQIPQTVERRQIALRLDCRGPPAC